MSFIKRRLAAADMGYAISSMTLLGETRIIAASEGKGPALVFQGPEMIPRTVSTSPGGSMGFAPIPSRDDAFLMITGFYPIFKAEQAGIELCSAVDGWKEPWDCRRILNLPFVHRIMTARTPVGDFLIAAAVCGGKSFQDDWSKPGTVYAVKIPDSPEGDWTAVPILEGLHRNHGMTGGIVDGKDSVLISADEGVFAINLPTDSGNSWETHKMLNRPVSELCLIDLDGDGEDELVTVEPFHGDSLVVYKKDTSTWTPVTREKLNFGHGLSVGSLGGHPTIVIGNRGGEMDLVCYRPDGVAPISLNKMVVDAGSGSAGTIITMAGGNQVIASSNPIHGEYALYREVGGTQ